MEKSYNFRKRKTEPLVENIDSFKKQKTIDDFFKSNLKVKPEIKSELKPEKSRIEASNFGSDEKLNAKIHKPEFSICHICDQSISNTYLSRHLSRHNRNKKCDICKGKFLKSRFHLHKCTASFFCESCNKKYPSQSKYDSHLNWHKRIELPPVEKPEYVNCPICNKLVQRKMIARHTKIHSKIEKIKIDKPKSNKYECKICVKNFQTKQRFDKHQKVHENSKRFLCSQCDQSFKHQLYLARHITAEHNDINNNNNNKLNCPICQKAVLYLASHLRWHKEDSKECEICGVTLRNKSCYIAHKTTHMRILKRNNEEKPLLVKNQSKKCYSCNKVFNSLRSFTLHNFGPCRLSLFPCPYCDYKVSKSMIDLCKHVSKVHRNIPEPYTQCNQCGEIVEDIDKHMKSHKINLYLYECQICDDKRFGTVIQLQRHINKKHLRKIKKRKGKKLSPYFERTTIKPTIKKVPCLICHKRVRISDMKEHVRNHDTLQCQTCMKLFFSLETYQEHKKQHSHSSVSCPICSRSFLSHVRLLAHTNMVHLIDFPASRFCPICKCCNILSRTKV